MLKWWVLRFVLLMAERMYAGKINLNKPAACGDYSAYTLAELYAATPGADNQFGISVLQADLTSDHLALDASLSNLVEQLYLTACDQRRHGEPLTRTVRLADIAAVSLTRLCMRRDEDGMHCAERLASVIFTDDSQILPLKSPMTGQGLLPWIGNVIRDSEGWLSALLDNPETTAGLLPITHEERATHQVNSIVRVASHMPDRRWATRPSPYYFGVHAALADGELLETVVPRSEMSRRTVGSILRYSV